MKPKGGKREGAGRPAGKPNKDTRALIARAEASGIMPIDVLLNDMRYYYNLGEELTNKIRQHEFEESNHDTLKFATNLKALARECAEKVSPYIHPRLASIEANVNLSTHETTLAELE